MKTTLRLIFDLVVRLCICSHRTEVIEIDRTDREWKPDNHEEFPTRRPPTKIMDVELSFVLLSTFDLSMPHSDNLRPAIRKPARLQPGISCWGSKCPFIVLGCVFAQFSR